MDPLTTAAASGLQARMDSLDMLANNLANTSTAGFKSDRELYSTYWANELAGEPNPIVGESPNVQRQWTDFTQGTLMNTWSTTDLALSGPGFFTVNGPNGPLYTRNGNFHFTAQGQLVTAEGYPVRLKGNQTLTIQSNDPISVATDGEVSQNGASLGQLEVVDFKDPSLLNKRGANYFQSAGLEVAPVAASNVQVCQGRLEGSNAAPAEAAAKMISLLRHFEMLQHAVKIGAEMNRQAVEQLARAN